MIVTSVMKELILLSFTHTSSKYFFSMISKINMVMYERTLFLMVTHYWSIDIIKTGEIMFQFFGWCNCFSILSFFLGLSCSQTCNCIILLFKTMQYILIDFDSKSLWWVFLKTSYKFILILLNHHKRAGRNLSRLVGQPWKKLIFRSVH